MFFIQKEYPSLVRIFSQCIGRANHHIEYFKYIKILFVSYASVNLKK